MPKYLRGVSGYENDYQQALKLKAHMAKTAVPEVKPKDWDFLYKRVQRRYSGTYFTKVYFSHEGAKRKGVLQF